MGFWWDSNETRVPIANPPNSAQQGGSPYQSPKLHRGPCSSRGRAAAERQTDRHTHIHTDARDHKTFRVVYDSLEMRNVIRGKKYTKKPKHVTSHVLPRPPTLSQRHVDLHTCYSFAVVRHSEFYLNSFRGFGQRVGVEICPFPLLWVLAFTTACTTVQTAFIVIRPHRSTMYVDAAYCYLRNSVVCLSVGLLVCLSVCRTSEPCKNA